MAPRISGIALVAEASGPSQVTRPSSVKVKVPPAHDTIVGAWISTAVMGLEPQRRET